MEENEVSTSDLVCEGTASGSNYNSILSHSSQSATNEMNQVILSPEESVQVVLADDIKTFPNILNIPIIDISEVKNLDEISVIANSSLIVSNTNIDQSSDIKAILTDNEKNLTAINPKSVTNTNTDESTDFKMNEMHVQDEAEKDCLNKREVMEKCENVPSPTNHSQESIPLQNKNNDSELKLS